MLDLNRLPCPFEDGCIRYWFRAFRLHVEAVVWQNLVVGLRYAMLRYADVVDRKDLVGLPRFRRPPGQPDLSLQAVLRNAADLAQSVQYCLVASAREPVDRLAVTHAVGDDVVDFRRVGQDVHELPF